MGWRSRLRSRPRRRRLRRLPVPSSSWAPRSWPSWGSWVSFGSCRVRLVLVVLAAPAGLSWLLRSLSGALLLAAVTVGGPVPLSLALGGALVGGRALVGGGGLVLGGAVLLGGTLVALTPLLPRWPLRLLGAVLLRSVLLRSVLLRPVALLGGLDGVHELSLLHRAGARDAHAAGQRLEVGEQHGVEPTGALLRAVLSGLGRGRGGFGGFRHVRSFPRISAGRSGSVGLLVITSPPGDAASWADDRRGVRADFCAEQRKSLRTGDERRDWCIRRVARRQNNTRTDPGVHRRPNRHPPPRTAATSRRRWPPRRGAGGPALGAASQQAGLAGRPGGAVAEGEHGGAGAGDDRRHAVGAQRAHQGQGLGHRVLAVVLVQEVLGGGEQVLGPCAGQRRDQQRRATRVGGRVDVRDRHRQQPAREGGRHRRGRHEDHGAHPRVDTGGDGEEGVAVVPGDDEPAEEGRGDVVGVALHPRGELEAGVVVHEQGAAGDQRARQADAADDGRRRRAESAAVRDGVHAGQRQAGRLGAHHLERGAHRADHQVRLAGRHGAGSLARGLDVEAGVGDGAGELVAQRQRQAQRVEPRAEVGARGRDGDPDRAVDEGRHPRLRPGRPRGQRRPRRHRPPRSAAPPTPGRSRCP